MTTHLFLKITCAIALATSSACASGSTSVPPSALVDGVYHNPDQGSKVTALASSRGAVPSYGSIATESFAESNSKYYDYIINNYGSYASIFNFPKSSKQVGSIANVGGQGCTNVLYGYGKKIFWIMAGDKQMTEYQVPKKPLKTLSYLGGQPSSCAMNASGDLAVGILNGFPNGAGDIVIFRNASGSGTVIPTALNGGEYFDGYDPKGNLFADGYIAQNHSSTFALVEVPKGSSVSRMLATSNIVYAPGSVQWDGKYLTVEDQYKSLIYQYEVHGTKATLKGTVTLSGAGDCAQTWIATGVVYCADAENDNGSVFAYPAGGSAIVVLTGKFDFPLGTVAVEK